MKIYKTKDMKTVRIELSNNNDLKEMFRDVRDDGGTMDDALECVMEEVQLRTIMERKYKKWSQHDTTIEKVGYKTIATVQMKKWCINYKL